MSDKVPLPTTLETYAVFRADTGEVLHFAESDEQAEKVAYALSSSPEYKDVPITWALAILEDDEEDLN